MENIQKKCFLPNTYVLDTDQLCGHFAGSEREIKYIGKILDGFSLASKSSTPSKVSRYWYFCINNNIGKLTCELCGLYCWSMFFMFLEIKVLVSNKDCWMSKIIVLEAIQYKPKFVRLLEEFKLYICTGFEQMPSTLSTVTWHKVAEMLWFNFEIKKCTSFASRSFRCDISFL